MVASERAEKEAVSKEDYSFTQQSLTEQQSFIQATSTRCLLGVSHCAEDTDVKQSSSPSSH